MANVLNYLNWRGDIPFSAEEPFNNVDAMILARVSNIPFEKITFSPYETFRTVAKKFQGFNPKIFPIDHDSELLKLLAISRRFQNLRLSRFIHDSDAKIIKQFSAITIRLRPREYFLSFAGTDDTNTGWREDFNFMFMNETPAQADAREYFRNFVKIHPLSRVYLGGHSKGGNLAMFAAIKNPDRLQRKLIKVYNFDGPGLTKELRLKDRGESVIGKIESFVPQDSLIGRLLEHQEKVSVIKSTAKNLYQHDIYSWEILKTDFVPAEPTKASIFNDRAISRWLEQATPSEREHFVEAAFLVLKDSKVETPMRLAVNFRKNIPAVLKTYTKISKEERKAISSMLMKLAESYVDIWLEN
ncbi:MAG: DUF2974 domain-containing protein [Candidatus Saccharibacteria bacterium]|nr:DUF2974 domain-containing protein [Candidatus Saccharibacteria bacterium]